MKLHEIEARDVQRFVDNQAERFAHWTARRRRNLVKQVLDYAVDNEWLGTNPMTGKRIKVPGEVSVREDVPEVEDMERLLDTLLNKPRPRRVNVEAWQGMKVQTVLIGLMGFRPGEAGGLHWDCVDLNQWRVEIKHGLTWHDGLGPPKNRQSVRTLDLDPLTHRVLSDHAEWTKHKRRPLKGYVLTTRQNGRVMPTTMRCRHHRALHFAGLVDAKGGSNFTPHALRHFAGSLWLTPDRRETPTSPSIIGLSTQLQR
jgi:integrase